MHAFCFLPRSELQVSLYLASGKEGNQVPNLKTMFWVVWVPGSTGLKMAFFGKLSRSKWVSLFCINDFLQWFNNVVCLCIGFMHAFCFLPRSELQVSLYLASGKEGNQVPNLKTMFWVVWVPGSTGLKMAFFGKLSRSKWVSLFCINDFLLPHCRRLLTF